MTALHTGDLLPPADVPLEGPAGGASARYRVSAAPPGVPADHAQTVGPAYLPGTVVAEGSAAEGALDYPVGLFLLQDLVSGMEDGVGCNKTSLNPSGEGYNPAWVRKLRRDDGMIQTDYKVSEAGKTDEIIFSTLLRADPKTALGERPFQKTYAKNNVRINLDKGRLWGSLPTFIVRRMGLPRFPSDS